MNSPRRNPAVVTHVADHRQLQHAHHAVAVGLRRLNLAMGCMPWLTPSTIITKKCQVVDDAVGAIIRLAAVLLQPLLMRMMMKHAARFIRRGDMPMASMSRTIFFRRR